MIPDWMWWCLLAILAWDFNKLCSAARTIANSFAHAVSTPNVRVVDAQFTERPKS